MKKNHLKSEKSLNIYKMLLVTAAWSTALLFGGCQNQVKEPSNVNIESNQNVDDKITENDSTEIDSTGINSTGIDSTELDSDNTDIPSKTDAAKDITPATSEDSNKKSTELFADMSKYQFVFASGVGAWQTMLTINEDGTFEGEYHDSDMGTVGEGYPNGVVYSSTFKGKFTEPKKVNEYIYSMSIEYINLEKEPESEEIIDGIKYIYSEPYGINDAKEILIYTPEAPVKELPEGFRSWVNLMDLDNLQDEYLGFYGIYNVETESGFSSYTWD